MKKTKWTVRNAFYLRIKEFHKVTVECYMCMISGKRVDKNLWPDFKLYESTEYWETRRELDLAGVQTLWKHGS